MPRDQGRQPVEKGGKQLVLGHARERRGLTEPSTPGTRSCALRPARGRARKKAR